MIKCMPIKTTLAQQVHATVNQATQEFSLCFAVVKISASIYSTTANTWRCESSWTREWDWLKVRLSLPGTGSEIRCASSFSNRLPVHAVRCILSVRALSADVPECGLYHASLSSLKGHTRVYGIIQIILRTRPVRIAAQLQRHGGCVVDWWRVSWCVL